MSDGDQCLPGDERTETRLRHCPMEAGGLVGMGECLQCPHRPEEPFTVCSVSRGRRRARARGFWDAQVD
jgi:hypothetical protein